MTPTARRARTPIPTVLTSTRRVLALTACLGLVLAGCGGAPAATDPTADGATGATTQPVAPPVGQDDVATLETDPPETSDATEQDPLVARYGEPVRLRLDMAETEEDAAYAIYDACVAGESGMSTSDLARPGGGAGPAAEGDPEDAAGIAQAHEDCLIVAPLPPWEYDVQNPDAVAFVQAVVDCLRTKGVQHADVEQDAGQVTVTLGGPENHGRSISLGMEHYDACEQEAVASGTGR